MAEEDNQNEGELQEGEGKGGKLKPVLIALLALLVGGGLGVGGAWFMLSGESQDQAQAQQGGSSVSGGSGGGSSSASQPSASSSGKKEMFQMSGLVVNLARSDRTRYLKTSIELELNGSGAAGRAEEMKPKLKDALLILLANHSVAELKTMQGKYDLKRQIVSRLNGVLGDGAVANVYFTEFVIQ